MGLTWSKCKTQGTTTGSDLPFLGEKSSSLGARVDRDPYANRRHLSIFAWNSVATREPKKEQKHIFFSLVQYAPRLPMVHHYFPPEHSILFSWGYTPFLDTSTHPNMILITYIYISIISHRTSPIPTLCIYICIFPLGKYHHYYIQHTIPNIIIICPKFRVRLPQICLHNI